MYEEHLDKKEKRKAFEQPTTNTIYIMQTITLTNVLPHVFASRTDLNSEVWKQNVKFEKEKLYLVEAMSGTG